MYQGDEELLGNKMTKSLLVFKLLRIKSTDSFCKKAMFCSLHPRRVAPTMGPSSSGDPMPPSGLLRQLHSCAHTHRHIIKNKTLKIPNCSLFLHPYPACSLVCIDLSLSLPPWPLPVSFYAFWEGGLGDRNHPQSHHKEIQIKSQFMERAGTKRQREGKRKGERADVRAESKQTQEMKQGEAWDGNPQGGNEKQTGNTKPG